MPSGRCEVCFRWAGVLHRHHWFAKRWCRPLRDEPRNLIHLCPACHGKDDTNARDAAELKAACLAVVARREEMEPDALVEYLTKRKWSR